MQTPNEKVLRNLQDAGCTPEIINEFFKLEQKNDFSGQLRVLSFHRKNLLDILHKNQKQIDCLDYLIFNMEQKIKGE